MYKPNIGDSMLIPRTPLLLLALAPSIAGAAAFSADYDQSRWESQQDGTVCHLSHPIPRFGLALFSQDARGEVSLTVFAHRPPAEEGRASLYSRSPEWKRDGERQLDSARLRADGSLLRFSHYNAQRILAELEQGQAAVMRFEGWWTEGVTELGLSPVNFRPALQAHLACLARLPQPAASAAAPAPAALRSYHPAGGSPLTAAAGLIVDPGPAVAGSVAAAAHPAAAAEGFGETAVYFSTNDAGLDLLAMDILRRFAARLQAEPGTTAVLTAGHTDPRGDGRYNRRLAERRAESVRQYLQELGVEATRIQVVSRGEEQLVSQAGDSYGLAENRRVTLAITH